MNVSNCSCCLPDRAGTGESHMQGGWAQGVESHTQQILLSHFHRCQRMIKMTTTHSGEVKVKMMNVRTVHCARIG